MTKLIFSVLLAILMTGAVVEISAQAKRSTVSATCTEARFPF